MNFEITMLAVPLLAVVVLGVLLATAGRTMRSMFLGMMGVFGVTFGGPGAMFVLGIAIPERASRAADVVETEDSDAGETAAATTSDAVEAKDDRAPVDHVDAATTPPASVPSTSSASDESDSSDVSPPLHEPIDERVTYHGPRSAWVGAAPVRGQTVDISAVSSGPCSRVQDCAKLLDQALQETTDDYVEWHLQHAGAATFVGFDLNYINEHFVKAKEDEELTVPSVGLMQQSHALLEFDQSARDEIDRRWKEAQATSRLLVTGLFGGAAIGLLGLLFGFFKLDNATRGFYTGRLQFAALAGILGLVATGVLVARWIPWL